MRGAKQRYDEVRMLMEQELDKLEVPCSIIDLARRVGTNRSAVIRHLVEIMTMPEFEHLSMVRIGGYDIVYRVAKRQGGDTNGRTNNPDMGGSGKEGQAEQQVLQPGEQQQI